MYYSLSTLTIIMLTVRVYYSQFSEFKQLNILNNYFHELFITFFGVSSLYRMLHYNREIDYKNPHEILGVILFLSGIYILQITHQEMKYSFSPRIDYDENRKLITTGIFSRVRHPMYFSMILLSLGTYLLCCEDYFLIFFNGSFTCLVLFRIPIEEKCLERQFPNYFDDMPRYRVIPYIY